MGAGEGVGATAQVGGVELAPPFHWRRRGGLLWIEVALRGAHAVFSTRRGGVSDGAYRSLNLGILTADEATLVARNRASLAATLGREPSGFAMGLQVHGANVESHRRVPAASAYVRRGTSLANADAQATSHPAVTPLVLVADCVPLVLSLAGAVGAVHCGWRGVAAGLVPNAVHALRDLAGGEARTMTAALGPGIGPCCYRVGEEVRAAFRARGHDQALTEQGRLDLALAVRCELEQAGLEPQSIWDAGLCTSCRAELFFSHRRDGGVTGRQAGLGWLTK